jgi:hypothetical protein
VEFIDKAKKANRPLDASTIIEIDVKLDGVQFKGARDFYKMLLV